MGKPKQFFLMKLHFSNIREQAEQWMLKISQKEYNIIVLKYNYFDKSYQYKRVFRLSDSDRKYYVQVKQYVRSGSFYSELQICLQFLPNSKIQKHFYVQKDNEYQNNHVHVDDLYLIQTQIRIFNVCAVQVNSGTKIVSKCFQTCLTCINNQFHCLSCEQKLNQILIIIIDVRVQTIILKVIVKLEFHVQINWINHKKFVNTRIVKIKFGNMEKNVMMEIIQIEMVVLIVRLIRITLVLIKYYNRFAFNG
ncbi:unnamed protein product [Paramecium sonneborni]|uniref:Uncharacterized protein n=1 Tax=Paramecium sonneborni TaxID=65129 RepID=A0A8S1PBW8_9CILI|nr:unnamed protein product [Paramecium sonneborni]